MQGWRPQVESATFAHTQSFCVVAVGQRTYGWKLRANVFELMAKRFFLDPLQWPHDMTLEDDIPEGLAVCNIHLPLMKHRSQCGDGGTLFQVHLPH